MVFKVLTIGSSAATTSDSGPKKEIQGDQRLSRFQGEAMVSIRTFPADVQVKSSHMKAFSKTVGLSRSERDKEPGGTRGDHGLF